jgi:CDP-glucose 4,6-dehydratase
MDFPSHFDILCLKHYRLNTNINDIRNSFALKEAIEEFKPDLIFHLAAQSLVLPSYESSAYTIETNVMGTANLLDACKEIESIKGICLITTDKVYEESHDLYGRREIDKIGANEIYSTSKACCELIAESYRKLFKDYLHQDIIISTLRAGNVLGGGDFSQYRIIPDYIRAILSNKEFVLRNPNSIRPYQHALDTLSGYLLVGEQILKENTEMNTSFNFGPDNKNEIDGRKLIELAKKYYGYNNVKINDEKSILENNYLTLDSTKAKRILNWVPKYNIEQTVEKTMSWYKAWIEDKCILTEWQIDEWNDKM